MANDKSLQWEGCWLQNNNRYRINVEEERRDDSQGEFDKMEEK